MRIAALSSVLALTTALMVYGCKASSGNNEFGEGGAGGDGGDSSSTDSKSAGIGGTNFASGVSSGTGAGGPGCSEAAKLIYVLSTDNDLYSFDPPKKQFKLIGPLGCNTTMQPNSMAVDRDATAWVNYVESDEITGEDSGGAVFKVSTVDASCQSTSIKLPKTWYRLGMGFSSDSVGDTAETLFITGTSSSVGAGDSPGLGKIDFNTNSVVPLGQFSGALSGESAELTGTGDARLFGFFTTTPVQVSEINKGNGATIMPKPLSKVQTPVAWAFSFWGGDFYLYTAPDSLTNSNVTRYHPQDGSTDTAFVKDVGFLIVGAGVSTCAPVEPPS